MKNILIYTALFLALFTQCYANPDIYTARGVIYKGPDRAQENTFDAIMAVEKWNLAHPQDKIAGCEVSLIVTHPKEKPNEPAFVCCHDEVVDELTGEKINIRTLTKEKISKLQIKQVLNGIDYGKPRPFAFFDDILAATMHDTPPFIIWIGVKDKNYRHTDGPSYTAIQLINALDNWHRFYLKEKNVDIFKYIIISSTNPFIVEQLDKESKKHGLEKLGLNIFPDYSDWGLPEFMWKVFIDDHGGFEHLYNLTTNWVSFEHKLINMNRINKYHEKNKKIMGWGIDRDAPYFKDLDAALLSY